MSFFPGKDPAPGDARAADAIDLVVVPRSVDVGHFAVRRALPHVKRRMVGPFIFFDHFGPAEFRAGQGIDVRPHPHIGLATVTFLFDGEIMHRDSLGTAAAIRPGEVNWMTSGRGIVHSARTAPAHRVGSGSAGHRRQVVLPAIERVEDLDGQLPSSRRPAQVDPQLGGARDGPVPRAVELDVAVRVEGVGGQLAGHQQPVGCQFLGEGQGRGHLTEHAPRHRGASRIGRKGPGAAASARQRGRDNRGTV